MIFLCPKVKITPTLAIFLLGSITYSSTTNPIGIDSRMWEIRNRDGVLPKFPLMDDFRRLSSNIVKAHEILRKGLQQYLDYRDTDFGVYLNEMIQRPQIYIDEYDKEITSYKKVFRFIWEQYNETKMQNYAIRQFDDDKLDVCSVARFLSHQQHIKDRATIMKRISDALEYRCHPCTPYKRKQYGGTKVPNTDHICAEEVSPDLALIMCKDYKEGQETAVQEGQIGQITIQKEEYQGNYSWFEISNGEVKWANDCDFPRHDVKMHLNVLTTHECAGLCIAHPRCNHFIWARNCHLKSTLKAVIFPVAGTICGYIPSRLNANFITGFDWQDGENGLITLARDCDFFGNDINDVKSKEEDCPKLCLAESKCTHFSWGWSGKCYLKTWTNKTPNAATIYWEGICGYVKSRAGLI